MANITRFHRKRAIRRKEPDITELDSREREALRVLTVFIRLAETLDRSHTALIQHVRFSCTDQESTHLEIVTRGDYQLELWGMENEKMTFKKKFGKILVFKVIIHPIPQ